MKLLMFGTVTVVADRICAVENGNWDNAQQDWWATLICTGGTRVGVPVYVSQAVAILESADTSTPEHS